MTIRENMIAAFVRRGLEIEKLLAKQRSLSKNFTREEYMKARREISKQYGKWLDEDFPGWEDL